MAPTGTLSGLLDGVFHMELFHDAGLPLNGNGVSGKPGCQAIETVGPLPARAIPDGGENAIPQPGPRRQRCVDGVLALAPLVVILAA